MLGKFMRQLTRSAGALPKAAVLTGRLEVTNHDDQSFDLFVEPLCVHYEIPAGKTVVIHFDPSEVEGGAPPLGVSRDGLSVWVSVRSEVLLDGQRLSPKSS